MAKRIKLPIVCLLVFCLMCMLPLAAAADGLSTYDWTSDGQSVFYLEYPGEKMVIPNTMFDTGNFMRFWDYDGSKRYDYIGPSDTVLQSANFAFNKWGVYTTLWPPPRRSIRCVLRAKTPRDCISASS